MENVNVNSVLVFQNRKQLEELADFLALRYERKFLETNVPRQEAKKYLNTKEAAQFLSVSPNSIRILSFRKTLKSFKSGNKLRFLQTDLEEWINSGRRKTPAELEANYQDALKQTGKGIQR